MAERMSYMDPDRPTADTPLGIYLPIWLERRSRRLAPSSAQSYAYQIAKWAPLYDRPIGVLTRDEVQAVVDDMEAEGLAPRTIRAALIVLTTALVEAVDNHVIPRAPTRGVRAPRPDPIDRRSALDEREAGAFARAALAVAPGGAAWRHWHGPPLALMLDVPLRGGEWRGLLWSEVELYAVPHGGLGGVIRVREQIPLARDGRGAGRTALKSAAATRDLPLTVAAAEVLVEHRERLATYAARRGTRGWSGRGLVFPGKRGGAASAPAIRAAIGRIAREAGLARVPTLHVLRHTYVSRAVVAGIDPRLLAKLLGHESTRTAYEAYLDLTDHARERIVEAMPPSPWVRGS